MLGETDVWMGYLGTWFRGGLGTVTWLLDLMILRVFQPQWFSGNDNYSPLRKKLLICISAVRLLQQADTLCVETAASQSYSYVQSTTTLVLPFLCSQRMTGVTLFQNLQCIFRFSPKVFQISTEKNFRCSKDEVYQIISWSDSTVRLPDTKNTWKAREPGRLRNLHLSHPSDGSPVIPSILAQTLPGVSTLFSRVTFKLCYCL